MAHLHATVLFAHLHDGVLLLHGRPVEDEPSVRLLLVHLEQHRLADEGARAAEENRRR